MSSKGYILISQRVTLPVCAQRPAVVHQTYYIVKFAVEGGQLVKRSEVQCPGVWKFQNSQPVVAGGVVYMVWQGSCVRFNMETGARVAWLCFCLLYAHSVDVCLATPIATVLRLHWLVSLHSSFESAPSFGFMS